MGIAWTEQLTERLRSLIIDGLSATQIANELSTDEAKISRNAVIGRAHRIGLKVGSSDKVGNRVRHVYKAPSGAEWRRKNAPKKETLVPKVVRLAPKREPVANAERGMSYEEKLTYRQRERARVLEFIERNEAATAAKGTPFMKRRADQCAYLLGSGFKALVCGQPVERKSYCATHAALCYTPVPARLTTRNLRAHDTTVTTRKVKLDEDVEVEDDELEPVDLLFSDQEDTENADAL